MENSNQLVAIESALNEVGGTLQIKRVPKHMDGDWHLRWTFMVKDRSGNSLLSPWEGYETLIALVSDLHKNLHELALDPAPEEQAMDRVLAEGGTDAAE
jgi:hypothetical protein